MGTFRLVFNLSNSVVKWIPKKVWRTNKNDNGFVSYLTQLGLLGTLNHLQLGCVELSVKKAPV